MIIHNALYKIFTNNAHNILQNRTPYELSIVQISFVMSTALTVQQQARASSHYLLLISNNTDIN